MFCEKKYERLLCTAALGHVIPNTPSLTDTRSCWNLLRWKVKIRKITRSEVRGGVTWIVFVHDFQKKPKTTQQNSYCVCVDSEDALIIHYWRCSLKDVELNTLKTRLVCSTVIGCQASQRSGKKKKKMQPDPQSIVSDHGGSLSLLRFAWHFWVLFFFFFSHYLWGTTHIKWLS